MRGDQKWKSKLAQAIEEGEWGVLDVYSDGGIGVELLEKFTCKGVNYA